MKPKLLLRISSVLMLFHTIGHTIGALTWKEAPNAGIALVISAMHTSHFNFMGRSVSFGLFYQGYGIIMILMLLFITASLWLLSNQISNPLTIKLLMLFSILLFLMSAAEYVYFFPFVAANTALAAICALAALISSKRTPVTL